jgi:hypothetical protein
VPLQIETIRANVIGALNLADVTNLKGIHLTLYATGCIFHYDKDFPEGSGKGFKESDTPNFTGSYYSRTKVRPLEPLAHEDWCSPGQRAFACDGWLLLCCGLGRGARLCDTAETRILLMAVKQGPSVPSFFFG